MNHIIVTVEGMMCPMCEAHANDAIRKAFPKVKNVSASHKESKLEILIEENLSDESIRKALASTGYKVGQITREQGQKKKKLFGIFG